MDTNEHTFIQKASGNEDEYIIKDLNSITIGRFNIMDYSKENRHCVIKLKFYKSGHESYTYLKEALKLISDNMFFGINILKLDIVAKEDVDVAAFTDLGFKFEGLMNDSIISENGNLYGYIFGTDIETYRLHVKEKNLVIKGRNISLKLIIPGMENELLEYYTRNRKYLEPFEPTRDEKFYTLKVQKRIVIENYQSYLNGDAVNFGIYKGDKFVGKLQISGIVLGIFKSAFAGYSIDEKEQGKGYMKEALKLGVIYAFNDLGLHRMEASTLLDNLRSQAVLQACGFKKIGLNPKYLFINGKWRDHITFCRINE